MPATTARPTKATAITSTATMLMSAPVFGEVALVAALLVELTRIATGDRLVKVAVTLLLSTLSGVMVSHASPAL